MSVVKVQGNASGTGIFTVAAPNSNTDRTLTLPDQTGTVLTNAGPFTANASASAGAVTIDASNNVGIGTTEMYGRVNVQRYTAAEFSTFSLGDFATASNSVGIYARVTSSGAFGISTAGAPIVFYNGGSGTTERARIDSSGNLLVGTTSAAQNTSGLKVLAAGSGRGITYGASGTADVDFSEFYRNTEGSLTRVGYIRTNGSSTTYSTSSDYRLKENVQPMTGALAKVAALNPVTYTWKATGEDSQGFIAHELQAVVPDCVTGAKDEVDAEGNPIYQGIDTSFLVATLTAAIQELKGIVDQQAARIAALEGL